MTKVRVLIADDHEVVRLGLRAIALGDPSFEVCGEAGDGRAAVSEAIRLKPDVVVLDVSMPVLNGLEATRQILKALPRTEVLVLTVHDSENIVREALQAGARGFVLKNEASQHLLAALRTVSTHKPWFTASVSELVLAGYLRRDLRRTGTEPRTQLTQREREVLQLLAEGRSNKEVAAELQIGLKTVETHRANIMNKLGLHSVADLVRYAIRNGIVAA
jgi:DNA-binding NarL/FixJ family response regulator